MFTFIEIEKKKKNNKKYIKIYYSEEREYIIFNYNKKIKYNVSFILICQYNNKNNNLRYVIKN